MKYISTRDTSSSPCAVSSADAIKRGLAPDRGLYMPQSIPHLTAEDLTALASMPYEQRAADILSRFLTDYDRDALLADCTAAYSEERFPGGAAPLSDIGDGIFSLELWHGPTCAFKDMALQIMPRLLSRALTMTGEKRLAHILVATSGDTGKAALEGYRDVPGVRITVFYPVDGVSPMQKRQMTTQLGENVNVCAVRGNFDDAQNGVKAIFADEALAQRANEAGFFFSSANSINWGRLAPQIVYYVSAYCDLVSRGAVRMGEPVNVCVPTGNFGNIFAAYIAREMGLPLGRLICASNSNCVLTDFIRTGVYDRTRQFYKTMSPSMDILISSNLERLLYLLGGSALTARCMAELSASGRYTAPASLMETLRAVFSGYFCTEEETAAVIRDCFTRRGYLCDTHTAVGLGAAQKYQAESGDKRPIILASTASPYKFSADVAASLGIPLPSDAPEDILNALSAATKTSVPEPLLRTLKLPVRFSQTVDPAQMPDVVFQ
ncbi:MAG: threonine synthase [Eubacteriales bacterium]